VTVRVAQAGLQTAGGLATSTFANSLPGGWIGFVERTTDLTGVVGSAVTVASVTVTVNTSRRIKISGNICTWISTVNGDRIQVAIVEGITQLQVGRSQVQLAGIATENPVFLQCIETPTAGTHTYALTVVRNGGTGSITVSGDNSNQSTYIMVEDVGPA
jgi:hypothetical protein